MGCGVSKLDADEDAVPGLNPFRHRIDDIKRRAWLVGTPARKDSIVSTTGLLRPEELQEDTTSLAADEDAPFGTTPPSHAEASTKKPPTTTMTPPAHVEVERLRPEKAVGLAETGEEGKEKQGEEDKEVEEKKKVGTGEEEPEKEEEEEAVAEGEKRPPRGPALVDRRGGRRGDDEEEELPGSPSFRVYFESSARESSDDESVKSRTSNVAGSIKEKKRSPVRKDSIDSITSEDSVGKHSKRHRARRFKGLTKGSSAVYGLLNVRSCYSVHSNAGPQEHPTRPCHSSSRNNIASDENPTLLSEKVT